MSDPELIFAGLAWAGWMAVFWAGLQMRAAAKRNIRLHRDNAKLRARLTRKPSVMAQRREQQAITTAKLRAEVGK